MQTKSFDIDTFCNPSHRREQTFHHLCPCALFVPSTDPYHYAVCLLSLSRIQRLLYSTGKKKRIITEVFCQTTTFSFLAFINLRNWQCI